MGTWQENLPAQTYIQFAFSVVEYAGRMTIKREEKEFGGGLWKREEKEFGGGLWKVFQNIETLPVLLLVNQPQSRERK